MNVIARVKDLPAASVESKSIPASNGMLWALGAVFFWSQTSVVLKSILNELPWLPVAFWTTLIAAVFFAIVMAVTGRFAQLRAMTKKQLISLAGIGVSGYFIYTCFNYAAYQRGSASEVMIVNYLWPVATVAFAMLISRERLRRREIGGLCLAVLGVVFVVTRGRFHVPQALDADLLALCGAVFYGLFSAGSKRVNCDHIVGMFISFSLSALLFLLTILFTRSGLPIGYPGTALLMCYCGVGVVGIPALLWVKALSAQKTSQAAILIYLTPALGLVWLKLLVPGEQITLPVLCGFALIVGGFLLQLKKQAAAGSAQSRVE